MINLLYLFKDFFIFLWGALIFILLVFFMLLALPSIIFVLLVDYFYVEGLIYECGAFILGGIIQFFYLKLIYDIIFL